MDAMMNPIVSNTSRTIASSDVKRGDDRLVLACGYHENGKFGYFVVWEHPHPKGVEYVDVCYFIEKNSERAFRYALDEFATTVKQYK